MSASTLPRGTDRRWFLVHTKVRGESTALHNLQRQGYGVYCPRILRTRIVRRRRVERAEPLFPRYLFLHVDIALQSLSPVRSTLGVSDLVRFGDEYGIVPNAVVEELMSSADPESGVHRLREPALSRGAQVRVIAGPFERLQGIFERYDGEERALILLEILGAGTRIRMPVGHVVEQSTY